MKKILYPLTFLLFATTMAQTNQITFPLDRFDFNAAPRTQLSPMSIKLFDDYYSKRPSTGVAPGNNYYGTLLAIYGYHKHWEYNLYFGADKKMYFRTSTWKSGRSENGIGNYNDWRIILDSYSDIESKGLLKLTANGSHYIEKGKLGIGTKTPDAKLSVNGDIHTKEVRVDLNGWADFVFEKNYKLPSLTEVEEHIKVQGHLSGIPSAEEVKTNGIKLGEMNKILLQKIEELTLYTIAQDKALKKQEMQLQVLKDENKKMSLFLINLTEKINSLGKNN